MVLLELLVEREGLVGRGGGRGVGGRDRPG